MLSGRAVVTVNGTPFELGPGESLALHRAGPHSYAPAGVAALLISVRPDDRPGPPGAQAAVTARSSGSGKPLR